MPVRTQAQIAKARPALSLYERFTNKAGWEITFVSAALRGLCRAGDQDLQLDGNKVYWSQTADEQQAWRCVRNGRGLRVRLVAASPQGRCQRAWPRGCLREADLGDNNETDEAAQGDIVVGSDRLGKTRKRASSSP